MSGDTKLTLSIGGAGGHTLHIESPRQPVWTPSRNGSGPDAPPAPAPPAIPATDDELAKLVVVGEEAAHDVGVLNTYKDEYLELLRLNLENAKKLVTRASRHLAECEAETDRLATASTERLRGLRVRLGEARRAVEDAKVDGVPPKGPHLESVEREYEAAEAEDRRLLSERLALQEHLQDHVIRSVTYAVAAAESHMKVAGPRLEELTRLVEGCANAKRELEARIAAGDETPETTATA